MALASGFTSLGPTTTHYTTDGGRTLCGTGTVRSGKPTCKACRRIARDTAHCDLCELRKDTSEMRRLGSDEFGPRWRCDRCDDTSDYTTTPD